MAKAGLHISGKVPFGYRRNPATKKLEIHEEEAKIIRDIFNLHSKGLGSYKIRDILNTEGYKPAKGNPFNLPAIKRIIRNPVYKGWRVFNDRKRVKKNRKFIYEVVDSIIVEDAHPTVIAPRQWDEANRENERRSLKSSIAREKHANKIEVY
ncbi:recombinase family protein [Priestia megaterium]|uniref:recombinase family protein n=1 Tax=Priestia megaterium TaxID=1404 RepID=UPI0020417289|nr:recombinase family protein [Priestia megaterium]MCM3016907.1 recombinase family protein [Priestia megaterium]